MKSRLCFVAILLAGIFLFEGCVIHSPMSETVMFHDKATNPTHESKNGFGFTGSYSPTNSTVDRVGEIETKDSEYETVGKPYNLRGLSGGFYYANYDTAGRYAFSGTLGALVVGLDATAKLWGRNYFTAGVSTPGHLQFYLQHRTLNSPYVALSLGVGYQQNTFFYRTDGYATASRSFNSVGIRSYLIFRDHPETSGVFRIGTYIGYISEIDRPIIQISLLSGFF